MHTQDLPGLLWNIRVVRQRKDGASARHDGVRLRPLPGWMQSLAEIYQHSFRAHPPQSQPDHGDGKAAAS